MSIFQVPDFQRNLNDAIAVLPKLQTGLDVNVKFTGRCYQSRFILSIRQKKAIRTITRNPFLAHTNSIFAEHDILPLPKLITYSQRKLMHSIIYGYCPPSLRQLFQCNEQREHNHNLRNAAEITVPYPRIELYIKKIASILTTNRMECPNGS
jgi:hypothetical protein